MTGSGKSTKATGLVADCPRVLAYDPLGEDYRDGVVFESRRELEAFWRQTYKGPFRMVYRPEDPAADFPRICVLSYECRGMALIVDEADMFCRNGRCVDREFTYLIGKGRHHDIDLICCTQAPKGLADFLRSQAHEWFIFMVKEPAHVDYLVKRCGGLVTAEEILALERWEYLHYRDYGEEGTPDVARCMDDLATGQTRRVMLHAGGQAADDQHHDPR